MTLHGNPNRGGVVRHPLLLAVGLLFLSACESSGPSSDPPGESPAVDEDLITSEAPFAAFRGISPIRIYAQNVYVGTDVDAVIAAGASSSDPAVLVGALVNALNVFDATSWSERADRIAAEVRRQDPDVIGLSEVSTVTRRGLVDFGVGDNTTDFLAELRAAFARHGLRYDVAGSVRNTDVMIPLSIDPATGAVITLPDGLPAAFVSLVDFDVMLVRKGVGVGNVVARNYQAFLPVNLGPIPVQIRRGFVSADIEVRGHAWRFVTTHPEPRSPVKEIQEAQVAELLATVTGGPAPLIIAGDMNSSPDDPAGSPYAQFAAAGFTDAWTRRIGIPRNGSTCCQQADLRNAASMLDRRLDQVWIHPGQGFLPPLLMTLLGDDQRERTTSGLWPSDHAGLFAAFLVVSR